MESNHENNATINSDENRVISRFRIAASQFCVVGALSILLFVNGSGFGFITILLAELDKDNPEITATVEDFSWIGSLNYLSIPVGNLLSGIVGDYFGRQRSLMMLAIPYLTAWLFYWYATNVVMIFASLILSGVACGLLEGIAITFTVEISEPRLRSGLSSVALTFSNSGKFLLVLLGRFIYWRTLALINMVLTIIYVMVIFWLPESPYWLASKGRYEKAELSLAWLRGWTTPIQVKNEFDDLRKTFESSSFSKAEENILKQYLERTFYIPFLLVNFTFFLATFIGTSTILTYSVIVFKDMNSPIEKYDAAIIAQLLNLIGTLIFGFVIQFTGKRKLIFFTMMNSGLASFTCSAILFYFTNHQLTSRYFLWIPTIMILLAIFLSAVGINMIPFILSGELFPIRQIKVGTGASFALFNIFQSLNNKIYLYMIDGVTLAGVFFLTGLINIIGCIVLYFTLPETEGKSFKEIEKYFSKKT